MGLIWLKRDDLYHIGVVNGGKARACWALSQGAQGLTTACSRTSPQAPIVAEVARHRGVPARIHCATGEYTPEMLQAKSLGATLVRHFPGYRTVIEARARADAATLGYTYVPFGMEAEAMVELTARQCMNLPLSDLAPELVIRRIVVPVGSGQTLRGIVEGLRRTPFSFRPLVVGVVVGKPFREQLPGVDLYQSMLPYHKPAPSNIVRSGMAEVTLDPYYEAKCLAVMKPGDLLWVVGKRTCGSEQWT
jgi:1-aminocyclopropane-1-carboxylate deaminase/D-cysteine desulfhydrase-like pyridoxal-dependent ACC family enzyme